MGSAGVPCEGWRCRFDPTTPNRQTTHSRLTTTAHSLRHPPLSRPQSRPHQPQFSPTHPHRHQQEASREGRASRALRERLASWSDVTATATTTSPRGSPAIPMFSTTTTRSSQMRTTLCPPSRMASGRPTRAEGLATDRTTTGPTQ